MKIKWKNPLYFKADVINIQNAAGLGRQQYLSADTDTVANFCKISIGLFAMLILIFTSVFLFIYNTMYISVSKDICYYGQLKTLGMTSIQLKRMVYWQAFWNSLLGIPLGLIPALLAVLNYLNMIAASIQNRSMELAVLESIEMTSRQIKKMLLTVGFGYAVISNHMHCHTGCHLSKDAEGKYH